MRYGMGFLVVSCILLCVSCLLLVLAYVVYSIILFCLSMICFFVGTFFIQKGEQQDEEMTTTWHSRP